MEILVSNQNTGVITLKETTDLISARHNDSMSKVEKLALEPSFGALRKTRIVYNEQGQEDECLNLIGTKIEVKVEDKNLTENLKIWRKDRNISKADYLVFVGNILEELMEPLWSKNAIEINKQEILDNYFRATSKVQQDTLYIEDIVDTIQDIQVFCINETELMGYDNVKCNNEVFKHINCRKQDPTQYLEWKEKGAYGKWKKWSEQPEEEIYQPDYESCKL